MQAIITGDMIGSTHIDPNIWLPILKKALSKWGKENRNWEVFRGDSFQINIEAEDVLKFVYILKATLKAENLDARMAIGLGPIKYIADNIAESNGEAFIYSGRLLDHLKPKKLRISSDYPENDLIFNTAFDLATLVMDDWKPVTAKIIQTVWEHPEMNQTEIAKLLDKTQSNISEGLKRAGYEELMQLENLYTLKIKALLNESTS
ncbi:transcriptional regulator [Rhizosphaericola mali]|uniref:Transcriptional regulator n=1 Tax=Rhizosphaericola mali TaxID=2545455 RepID=A0A5P2G5S2_9BACT|nr:transcriptional regulator [Rhizosphaericola mali]QES90587.1 transcriptional regulator [Rhizosphaericola mali]